MGCSVRELLERFDSLEIAEWRAFERALGPIGPQYSEGALAHIHEVLQGILYMLGAQAGEDNPAPKPQHFPRPNEVYLPQDEVPAESDPEFAGGADELSAFFDNP